MTDKRESRPLVAQETGQAETAACGRAAISSNYSTTAPACRQAVSDLLCVGEENGMTMKRLLQVLNGDSRTIRLRIELERKNGCPILSGRNGYWICGSPDEAKQFCRSMRSRAKQIMMTARAVERAAGLNRYEPQQLDGQGCIWAGGDNNG